METKLFDSELKVMGVLWREGECTAKHISERLGEEVGWNRNTTYTIIKRCVEKGAVQHAETDELVSKLFDGSADKLFASLLGRKKLSAEQVARLREIVGELE